MIQQKTVVKREGWLRWNHPSLCFRLCTQHHMVSIIMPFNISLKGDIVILKRGLFITSPAGRLMG